MLNGDVGTIINIDLEEQAVTGQLDGQSVTYNSADLNEITLAWTVTIHKSQRLLSRKLLYTGLTRDKKTVILVGPKNDWFGSTSGKSEGAVHAVESTLFIKKIWRRIY